MGKRDQVEAYRVARAAYPFRCCVVCGLQIPTCLTVAHLDHDSGNNELSNLEVLPKSQMVHVFNPEGKNQHSKREPVLL